MDTQDLSIAEMGRLLRSRAVTAESLARDALSRVAARTPAPRCNPTRVTFTS